MLLGNRAAGIAHAIHIDAALCAIAHHVHPPFHNGPRPFLRCRHRSMALIQPCFSTPKKRRRRGCDRTDILLIS
jgi:hypothetical protein